MPHSKSNTKSGVVSLVTLSFLLFCLALTSCGNGKQRFTGPSALETGHWYQAKSNPPTYYPKGIRSDHPTKIEDGSWVYAGDQAGTRYFIPDNGADGHSSQDLESEALAAMHPSKKKALKKKLNQGDAMNPASTAINATIGAASEVKIVD
jgi:hypothetical protein